MNQFYNAAVVAMLVALGGTAGPVNAAPPTVTPSPGYDARLQEARAAGTAYRTVAPVSKPLTTRRLKRTQPH